MRGNSSSVVHGLSAAKKFTSKAVFCVDSLDPSVGVNELCDFVLKVSVDVLSCFRAQPRRQRNEFGPVADRAGRHQHVIVLVVLSLSHKHVDG